MASERLIVFAIYSAATGAPLASQAPTFVTIREDNGTAIAPAPAITEIGGGLYKFTAPLPASGRGVAYVIDCGAASAARYMDGYYSPEEAQTPYRVATLHAMATGRRQVHTSGAFSGRLVHYDPANPATVVQKFRLLAADGVTLDTAAPFVADPEA